MTPITNQISSLSATPYVDAFTTGEILGFVVLIICTQIVITWIAVRSIKAYVKLIMLNFRGEINGSFTRLYCEFGYIKATIEDTNNQIKDGIK